MQVPETDVYWTYSLLNTSQSKASARTGTPAGASAQLVGVDGTNNGGLSPFAGFREVYRFTPELQDVSYGGVSFSGSNPYVSGTTAHKCRVVDFWSFSVLAGTSTRVIGYVYVVRRANDASCNDVYDLMMAFYAPQSTGTVWKTILLQQGMSDGGLLADQGKAVMSVETTSKAVYVFRRGVTPISVYFKTATGPTSTIATVNTSAGPGKKIAARPFTNTASPSVEVDFPTSAGSAHDGTWFDDPATGAPGSVVFCRIARGTTPAAGTSGAGPYVVSNLSTAPALTAGTYSLAVQFEDTRSGRKSQLSTNVDMTVTSDRQFFIDGVYDSNKFDTLNVYRSVRTGNAAGAYTGGILQLEAQITLSSYTVTSLPLRSGSLPTSTGTKYFRYAYQLKDAALVMQDVFLDKPSYSETMPKGGAGALLDGTMLVGNISESANDLTGTGETRWSASGVDSPELFTALGQYKPSNVGDAVTCFKRTGQIMAGFTRNGVQFFSKQDGYVRVLAAHQGYGITGPYAATTVGPVTYFVNYRGLKAVYPDGRLDDVQAINQLIANEWYSDTTGAQELSKVSMAFDPATLCLYILNPARQAAVQFWFATGVVSELEDTSFNKVTSGWWEDSDGQLVPRALFLYNAPYAELVTNTNFRPAVYMPSRTYGDKLYPEASASPQVSMLDADAKRCPVATTSNYSYEELLVYDNTCSPYYIFANTFSNIFDTNPATNYRLIGMWVYQISPTIDLYNGGIRRARIIDISATTFTVEGHEDFFAEEGMTLVLDPVYMQWIGSPLRLQESKDEEFAVKQPTSMGVVIADLEKTPYTNHGPANAFWVGSLFRNNETTPLFYKAPTDASGTISTNSLSLMDSANWVGFSKHSYMGQWFLPAFQTFMPNVYFRLVGAQVKGRMLPTDRTRRTY
jgi:hypothetical protein